MKKVMFLVSMIASITAAHAALPCAMQVTQAVEKDGSNVLGIEVNRTGTYYRVYYMFDGGDWQSHGHILIAVDPRTCAVSDSRTWKLTK